MKRQKKLLYTGLLLVITIISMMTYKEYALGASAALTGNTVVRGGDYITVNLYISAPGSYGIEGNFSYNSSVVSLVGVQSALNGWKVEMNGNRLIAYDDALTHPLSGSQAVVTASFKVNNVAAGTSIAIAVNNIVTTDGTNSVSAGNAVYNTTVAPPMSGENSLGSLSVEGFNIGFSKDKTTYDLGEVEFSTSSLKISATASDKRAVVSVGNTALAVGDNTVYINVKAENGTTKTYAIKAKRKQDPNYVPSKNANLSKLITNTGTLSPAFKKDVTEYVVYLPYETKTITVQGTAEDSKAKQVINDKNEKLVQGENKLKVTVVAEDGTEKKYNITVVVMPKYEGNIPQIGEKQSEQETTVEITTTVENSDKETTTLIESSANKTNTENNKGGVPVVITVLLVLLGGAIGFGIEYLINYKKSKK